MTLAHAPTFHTNNIRIGRGGGEGERETDTETVPYVNIHHMFQEKASELLNKRHLFFIPFV